MKHNNKQTKKVKKQTKKFSPKKSIHEVRIVVAPAIEKELSEPEKSGGKFMIPKTWVSERQVIRLVQKTPPQLVLKRKGRGGMTFDYVPGVYFKRVLNYTFGWLWDFLIDKQELVGMGEEWAQVITTGHLIVKDDKGHTITKSDVGKADVKYLKGTKRPMDLGNDYKASATDCLKRCGAQLGIASDVYGRMSYKEETSGEEVVQTESKSKKEVKSLPPNFKQCPKCPYGNSLSDAEEEYSKKIFGKAMCRDCQNDNSKK